MIPLLSCRVKTRTEMVLVNTLLDSRGILGSLSGRRGMMTLSPKATSGYGASLASRDRWETLLATEHPAWDLAKAAGPCAAAGSGMQDRLSQGLLSTVRSPKVGLLTLDGVT